MSRIATPNVLQQMDRAQRIKETVANLPPVTPPRHVTKCCGSAVLTLYYRTYEDGRTEWGYACKCGKARMRLGNPL